MKKNVYILFLSFIAITFSYFAKAQLVVTPNQTATALAAKLTGTGVSVSNAVLNCPGESNGIFVATASNLGLDSGILLTTGLAQSGINGVGADGIESDFAGYGNNNGSDPDLNILSGQSTFDKCILEFDFIPAGDSIKFDYVFGSEEYDTYSCSQFNDAFGFFISGPGITGSPNIALIPGTNIGVTINSTTDPAQAVPQPTAGNIVTFCNSMGPGSPFTQYYVANLNGTTIAYNGFTTVLTALSAVTPCLTYHLKLAIADASDPGWDSGTFLKAGSLSSNSVTVEPIGGGGLIAPEPYCVRECLPGQFVFTLNDTPAFDYVVKFDIGGTAVPGYDYTPIADSIIIPGGQISASAFVYGLAVPPVGPKTVILYIKAPFNCNGVTYVDTVQMNIYDSLYANILTPDTAICRFESVDVFSIADTILTIQWTPALTVDSVDVLTPTMSPTQTTTYTMIASLPGSGCAPVHNTITITIADEPVVDLGADFNLCLGASYQFQPTVTPSNQTYSFTWSPPTYLDNTNTPNPTTTPTGDITYYVMATPTIASCPGYDTISIHVIPNDFTLENVDTSICQGEIIAVRANGPVEFTYHWTPSVGVSDPFLIDPIITPDTSATYVITATYPNCPDIVKSFTVDVQPIPQVFLGPDREICQWVPADIEVEVLPSWYSNYTYDWSLAEDNDADSINPYHFVYHGDNNVEVIVNVSTPIGCVGADTMNIVVHPGNFGTATPLNSDICPRDTVLLTASGGVTYQWSPDQNISDVTSPNPTVYPEAGITYNLIITDQYGCTDTFDLDVAVHSNTVISLPDSVRIWPGETYQMNPGGNALYYAWFPPAGLSDDDISNPIASPTVNTRYYVEAKSEWGCEARDSIDVLVTNESVLDVPNAFIPGTDVNGRLKIVKKGIATLEYFRIFNRWGQVVFETKDINEGWDGTFNGEPQPLGVYVYMVEAFTSTNERFYKQGNITLIR